MNDMSEEYLEFHIKALLDIFASAQVKLGLYPEKNEIAPLVGAVQRCIFKGKIIKTEQDLQRAFSQGATLKAGACSMIVKEYIAKVLQATPGIRDFFIDHETIGVVQLNALNPYLHQFSAKECLRIFTNDNLAMARYDHTFNKTVSIVGAMPHGRQLIKGYLMNKNKKLPHEICEIQVRELLRMHFPDELPYFKEIAVVADYLHAQDEKHHFVDTSYAKEQREACLMVDLTILKNKYPHGLFLAEDYCKLLYGFIHAWRTHNLEGHLCSIDSCVIGEQHHHEAHVKINLSSQQELSGMVNSMVEMLNAFFKELAYSGLKENMDYKPYAQQWLQQFLLQDKLPSKTKINTSKHKV